MPELPEVETIRRSLEPALVGRFIRRAMLLRRDVLVAPGDPRGGFSRQRTRAVRPVPVGPRDLLAGSRVTRLLRHGKQLAMLASGEDGRERALVVHLGMSGQMRLCPPGTRGPVDRHVHARWWLDDGLLLFRDPRRFGVLRALPSLDDLDRLWSALGPDALTITPESLAEALARTARPVKSALLDQSLIAGIGNIYADEALFRASITPRRPCPTLSPDRIAALADAIVAVLRAAIIGGGSTIRDYAVPDGARGSFQSAHAVYGRAGAPCLRCTGPLSRAVIGQRTTVWCPRCQR